MSEFQGSDEHFKRLAIEQEKIQLTKFQGRLAGEYDQYIFLGRSIDRLGKRHETSEVEEFLMSRLGRKAFNLEGVLEGLIRKRGAIHWTDMGGGRGLAMRQMMLSPKLNHNLETSNIDINNYDLSGLKESEIEYLEEHYPGITKDSVKPKFILGNAENIQLLTPVDLITSVEMMQYLDHPIAAICDWYNQLKNGGLMIVSAEHKWSGWIRYEGTVYSDDPHPMEKVLEILEQNNIPFAASGDSYQPGRRFDRRLTREFCNLVIQKVASTYLEPASSVKEIWYNPSNYKAVYYEVDKLPIQVSREAKITSSFNQRYSEQLAGVKRSGKDWE
jgi:SAM-dependent methyltransferase